MKNTKIKNIAHIKHSGKKLAAYSAMAASFALLHEEANAQVLYTDVYPEFLFTQGSVSAPEFDYLTMDFNADGLNELLAGFASLSSEGSCYRLGYRSFYLVNYISVLASATTGGYENLKALDAGAVISAGAHWVDSDALLLRPFAHSDFYMDTCDADIENASIDGVWNNKSQKYLGIRFTKDGSKYYGYVRVTAKMLPDSGDAIVDTLEIEGFAYEQTPNTSIIAGTGVLPDAVINPAVEFAIYPNPASEMIYIKTENAIGDKLRYTITDMQGRHLITGDVPASNSEILIRDLSAGMYLLQLLNESNQQVGVHQFIKQ